MVVAGAIFPVMNGGIVPLGAMLGAGQRKRVAVFVCLEIMKCPIDGHTVHLDGLPLFDILGTQRYFRGGEDVEDVLTGAGHLFSSFVRRPLRMPGRPHRSEARQSPLWGYQAASRSQVLLR